MPMLSLGANGCHVKGPGVHNLQGTPCARRQYDIDGRKKMMGANTFQWRQAFSRGRLVVWDALRSGRIWATGLTPGAASPSASCLVGAETTFTHHENGMMFL